MGIDQSGEIHDTNHPTGLAVCPINAKSVEDSYTVLVPIDVTREVRQKIGRNYNNKAFQPRMFAVGLYYLLQDRTNNIQSLYCEVEYTNHMDYLLNLTCNWLRDSTPGSNFPIEKNDFQSHSREHNTRAHEVANLVRTGDLEPNRKLAYEDFANKM